MKTTFLLAFAISTVAYSQSSFAGSITDTYTTGDTLTADKLTNIKSAVNDNDNRIRTVEAQFLGDGSAGDLFVINGDVDWVANPPANPFFTNINIGTGYTLRVPAGTTIYVTGSFVNQGTVIVDRGAITNGTAVTPFTSSNSFRGYAHPGDTPGAATMGESNVMSIQPSPGIIWGGNGGRNIPRVVATTSFGNFKIGGGSGAGGGGLPSGGGLLKVYAGVQIINQGTIDATGLDAIGDGGTGGGGGGIVVLAARGFVDNSSGGVIDVSGGAGNGNVNYVGNGGGGGGGIIIMASPTPPMQGVLNTNLKVSGGLQGQGTVNVNGTSVRIAGGGGGGSGGLGGAGGSVQTDGTPNSGGSGGSGYIVSLTLDPIFLAR